VNGSVPKGSHISSPWLEAKREVKGKAGKVTVTDSVENHKKYILSSEIQSPEFTKLQMNLRDCFENVYLVYTPLKKGHRKLASGKE
jgi:hypothetical protein